MKNCTFFLLIFFPVLVWGQQSQVQRSAELNNAITLWLNNLSEKGLEVRDDSLIMGTEFKKVLEDENYRKTIYPEIYSWEQVVQLIQSQELKKAFWFLINLYPENEKNKEMVVKSVLAYDHLFKMDEMLVNVFYTYCFLDPNVSQIINGSPEVVRPDIMESKLRNVKEIVDYIYLYRSQKEKSGIPE